MSASESKAEHTAIPIAFRPASCAFEDVALAGQDGLTRLRTRTRGKDFRYDMNHGRFHFSGVMDGARAREILGFVPRHPIDWSD